QKGSRRDRRPRSLPAGGRRSRRRGRRRCGRDRRDRRHVAQGYGPRDEGGDGEARRTERGRQDRQRPRATQTRRLTPQRPPLLARAAGLTGAATLTSRVLGLLRDQVLAAVFGAS